MYYRLEGVGSRLAVNHMEVGMASGPPHEHPSSGPRGIASRAGVWSAKHRKTAIWGWLAFVFLALAIGNAVGTKTLEHTQTGVGESGRADQTIADAAPEHAQEMVLIQSSGATAGRSGSTTS